MRSIDAYVERKGGWRGNGRHIQFAAVAKAVLGKGPEDMSSISHNLREKYVAARGIQGAALYRWKRRPKVGNAPGRAQAAPVDPDLVDPDLALQMLEGGDSDRPAPRPRPAPAARAAAPPVQPVLASYLARQARPVRR